MNGVRLMSNKYGCAFSGHRPKSLPWKHDETSPDCLLLKEILAREIKELVARVVTQFYTGLAEGVDTWAAQIALDLRDNNPALNVHCILPCRTQAKNWDTAAQMCHKKILEKADSVVCISEEYYDGCMLDRNRYLVDHSDILLAVYNGSWRSGTGMTVRYAKKLGREVIIIDPKTRNITRTEE